MQLDLIPKKNSKYLNKLTHGGVIPQKSKSKSKRKIKKPLIEGKITHVVFKSSKAKGDLSFYKHKVIVNAILKERSKKYFIEIKDFVNMGNHLHLKVRFKNASYFKNFLRTFTALLARRITGARKGHSFGKFWDGLAYTRVLLTKFEELGLRAYFQANRIERDQGYSFRKLYLDDFNAFLKGIKFKSQGFKT